MVYIILFSYDDGMLQFCRSFLSGATVEVKVGGGGINPHGNLNSINTLSVDSGTVELDGFNLLWILASQIQNDGPYNISQRNTCESGVDGEIFLDSTWPRRVLTYIRRPVREFVIDYAGMSPSDIPYAVVNYSSIKLILNSSTSSVSLPFNTTSQSHVFDDVSTHNIGFEMEFLMEKRSGPGYLFTGRTLNTLHGELPIPSDLPWFGLYAEIHNMSYTLRMEYESHDGIRTEVHLPEHFKKQEWQKLSTTINFQDNNITYWLNCSKKTGLKMDFNGYSSTFQGSYEILQPVLGEQPIKIIFRSVIVTKGSQNAPKLCRKQINKTGCSGGKIYMTCGPSCEHRCAKNSLNKILKDVFAPCAIACVAGCHCSPGFFAFEDTCIPSTQCPCMIGMTIYNAHDKVMINNEICKCTEAQWHCFAIPRFTHTPRNLTIRVGRTSQITCAVSGNPLPEIKWKGPPLSSYYIVDKHGGRISALVIRNATENDNGIYICAAKVEGWVGIVKSYVRVLSPPVIKLPSSISVSQGYPVLVVDCEASGLPPPIIQFRRNGETVLMNDHIAIYKISLKVLRLKLRHVQTNDAGEWVCIAYNSIGYSRQSVRILVRLPEPHSMAFYRRPVDQYVRRGSTAVFNCQIWDHQSEMVDVLWRKDGITLNAFSSNIVFKRYRLIVQNVQDNNAGEYSCIVREHHAGLKLKASAKLMIKGQMLSWSEWSQCSVSCGRGIMFKRRTCTGVPPNKNTCHGKFIHIKHCNIFSCPAICSVIGDPHYKTFDGRYFNFHGDCGYVLSHDASGNEFKVILYNGICGRHLSCLEGATIILSLPGYAAIVDIHRDGTVAINSMNVHLPYMSTMDTFFIAKIGLYTILRAGPDFELRWALPHRLYLIIGPKYNGRTQGFCGNYNDNPNDDNITPSGRSAVSDLEFGQSWTVLEGTVNFSCSAFRQLSNPCQRDKYLRTAAQSSCSFLKNQMIFGSCHTVVPPHPFVESCMFDICSSSIKRTSTYFCTALSAYSEECIWKGVILNWRTAYICNQRCFSGKVYRECGPTCIHYCPGFVNKSGQLCSSNGQCISGCHCPDGEVLHRNKCINPIQCPCVHHSAIYENGTSLTRNCEECICSNGKWQCIYNKDLCKHPPYIAQGPVSQVALPGYQVVFCCETLGIPIPRVDWYHNGKKIVFSWKSVDHSRENTYLQDSESVLENSRNYLNLHNVTAKHGGSYKCKATNQLGSLVSESAQLTIMEFWIAACDPTPKQRTLLLPEGCYSNQNLASNRVEVGQCQGLPCSSINRAFQHRERSCGGPVQCCQPSVTKTETINCSHSIYATSFLITVVLECACTACEETTTIIEGALKTSHSGTPLKHIKLLHQGRVITYSSNTGSFRVTFPKMSDKVRYVTFTFVDVIFRRFPATVKNLPIIVGSTTIHTVVLNTQAFHARFNASTGFLHTFRRPRKGNGARLRLIIPPSSLVLQHGQGPYIGEVEAVFSLVENDHTNNKKRLLAVPGYFLGINHSGMKKLILPSYVLSVSLYDHYGRSVEIYTEKTATFIITSHKFKKQILPWVMDELSGLWREHRDGVVIYPRFNKNGDKVLLLSTKITHFGTSWALSAGEDPCYVRVQVLDVNNKTVPAVRVTMITINNRKVGNRRIYDKSNMQTIIEDLTRIADVRGLCMPVDCQKFVLLFASKLGNELVHLQSESHEHNTANFDEHQLEAPNDIINISRNIEYKEAYSLSQPRTYFQHEDDCKTAQTEQRTYIFRDQSFPETSKQYATPTSFPEISMLDPVTTVAYEHMGRNSNPMKEKFCHMKIVITYSKRWITENIPMIVEIVTFIGRNVTRDLRILGWRRESILASNGGKINDLKKSSRIRRKLKKSVCIEFMCTLENKLNIIVYVTIRPADDRLNRPSCSFLSKGSSDNILRKVNNVHLIFPSFYKDKRQSKEMNQKGISGYAFMANSYVESKSECTESKGHHYISANVKCS